jgi:hypothetical protein
MAKQKSKASDFGALIQAHRKSQPSGTQAPESLEKAKILAKSRNPGYVKLTAYVPRELHLNLKLALTKQGREISHLITELVSEWLKSERK